MNVKPKPHEQYYDWGRMIWLADSRHCSDLGLSLARMEVRPGMTSDPHSHSNCYECIHVVSGCLKEFIGDKVYDLGEGETVVIPPGVKHYSQNFGTDDLLLVLSYSTGNRDYAAE